MSKNNNRCVCSSTLTWPAGWPIDAKQKHSNANGSNAVTSEPGGQAQSPPVTRLRSKRTSSTHPTLLYTESKLDDATTCAYKHLARNCVLLCVQHKYASGLPTPRKMQHHSWKRDLRKNLGEVPQDLVRFT
ncbi:unnamed protein product [Ectocarpus sp. 12 AP-2014]